MIFYPGDKVKINSTKVDGSQYLGIYTIQNLNTTFAYCSHETEPGTWCIPLDSLELQAAAPDTPIRLSRMLAEKLVNKPQQDTPNNKGGVKFDNGKIDYTLLFQDLPNACESVTKVLMLGANKYGRANYLKVENDRYDKALLRHLMDYLKGIELDSESGESHLAHLVCCAMFLLEKQKRGIED